MSNAIKHITDDSFSFRKRAWCICLVRAIQSNYTAALSTSFLLNHDHPADSSKLNTLISRFRESYSSVGMSRESKRLKKSRSD